MIDTIQLNKDTSTDELMTLLEHVLGLLVLRVGVGMTVATLFGTAVGMTVEDMNNHDR